MNTTTGKGKEARILPPPFPPHPAQPMPHACSLFVFCVPLLFLFPRSRLILPHEPKKQTEGPFHPSPPPRPTRRGNERDPLWTKTKEQRRDKASPPPPPLPTTSSNAINLPLVGLLRLVLGQPTASTTDLLPSVLCLLDLLAGRLLLLLQARAHLLYWESGWVGEYGKKEGR